MLRRLFVVLFIALVIPAGLARAQTACLPSSIFQKNEDRWYQPFELGFVADRPTLCRPAERESSETSKCWSVDPETGALTDTSALHLPGLSQWRKVDASGCIDGLCTGPLSDAYPYLLWVSNTSDTHIAIYRDRALHIFDAASKRQTALIPLYDEKAPSLTNVSNEPVRMLFQSDTLYVVGSDAGPYMAVWVFKQDGTRLGLITERGKPDSNGLSVYNGAANMLDSTRVIAANAGLRTAVVVSSADGKRQLQMRHASSAPCTREEMSMVDVGDIDQVSRACRRIFASRLEPYFNVVMIALPSGDFLAALSGKGRGSLAVLDRTTLMEKRRLRLARCPG